MMNFGQKAREYADSCFSGKRWGGNPLLVVVDTALTSTGLKYFTVIVPRVEEFNKKFGHLSFTQFSKFSPEDPRLLEIFNNPRAWKVAVEICKLFKDFSSLKDWAVKADYNNFREDSIGKISGIGLNTFQYLRMQVGVDTAMPDRIIWKSIETRIGRKIGSMIELIDECEKLSRKIGISQVELCWRIWLKESDKKF